MYQNEHKLKINHAQIITNSSFSLCSQNCLPRFQTYNFRLLPSETEVRRSFGVARSPIIPESCRIFRARSDSPNFDQSFVSSVLDNSDLFLRTNNILVEGPTTHRDTFFTPFILELQFFNLLVGKSHHIMRQHGTVLDQFLDFYFSKEYVQVHG